MPEAEARTNQTLQIPVSLIGRVDVSRLIRELDALENFLGANAIREPGTQAKLPRTSKMLDEILQMNKLNALIDQDRRRLDQFLRTLKDQGPLLHMSFSADPSPFFTEKLITWLRREIHPLVLVQIGLQPGLGAGCMVRTANKYFDFSLRERFSHQRTNLLTKLSGGTWKEET